MRTKAQRIKELREALKLSQMRFAEIFDVDQVSISNWEGGKAFPRSKTLKKILETHPHVNLEWIISEQGDMFNKNIPKLSPEKGREEIREKIVPVIIDKDDREYITFIPEPAQAGFARDYPDNYEIMKKLPSFNIPGYSNGTAVAFPVEGVSMSPTLLTGDIVVAEPVSKLEWISPKDIHVIVTDRGTLIKRFIFHKQDEFLEWICDNDFYNEMDIEQRKIPIEEVRHIFRYVMHISRNCPVPDSTLRLINQILQSINSMAQEIRVIHKAVA